MKLVFRVPKFDDVEYKVIDMTWHGRNVGDAEFSGFRDGFAYFTANITDETFAMMVKKGKMENTDISLGYRYDNKS